ncbi:hypothetical protein [Microbacterium foliorum]|uniref:hypothetical protein n=1 Tax=Microbacterium foliorum TaxID=104336 RepID=UPI0012DFE9C8|nr:hypothetical protein [Microbacterium foliorum]
MNCGNCGRQLTPGAPLCAWCGQAVAGASSAIANGPNGIAAAGPNARVKVKRVKKVTKTGNSWDTRPKSEFAVKERSVSGWLELVAAVVTLVSAAIGFFAARADLTIALNLLVFAVVILIAVVAGFFAVHFAAARMQQHSVVRVGSWVLGVLIMRDGERALTWASPEVRCPWCPPAKKRGVMSLEWADGEPMFICKANPKQHRNGFDWTQV